jgi:hypothetical protein
VKEASLSPQGKEEVPIKADKNPSPAKGLIHQGFLGSKTVTPTMPVAKECSRLLRVLRLIL